MSEFLESIGAISLILLGLYFFMQNDLHKTDRDRKIREFAEHSWTAKILIYDYYKSVNNGNPIMSKSEYNKILSKILNNPIEIKLVNESIKKRNETENRIKEENKIKRKVGYKYDVEIFEIFDLSRELSLSELLKKMEYQLNKNENQLNEILNIWIENSLIINCPWDNNLYEVGEVLINDYYKLDENDITRKKWLEINNKTLNPESLESLNYFGNSLI